MKKRSCGGYVSTHRGCKLYCGKSKTFGDGEIVKEYCSNCTAHHKGYKEGYNAKIKTKHTCQLLTCGKTATRVVCIQDIAHQNSYIIEVCGPHSNGYEWKELKKDKEK